MTTNEPLERAPTATAGDGGLSLTALHEANIARQAEWCPDQVPDLSFRGNELAGETGEACNVIKKLERERQGWRGSRATMADLAEELADVVICADLCAVTAGIDLSAAVTAKFNATSDKVGISVRLPLSQAPAVQAPAGEARVTLAECPIGLFLSEGGALCLKTEYGNNEGRIDAHIVESGEFFWGHSPQTIASQRCQRVTPVPLEQIADAITLPFRTPAQPKAVGPVGEEALREALAVIKFAQTIDDHYEMREFLKGWSEGDVSEWPEFSEALAQSHPTTVQETVATPRDGGVREALTEVVTRAFREHDFPGKSAVDDEGGYVWRLRDRIVAALSAPGSAGPGEWPAGYQETFDAIGKAVTVHPDGMLGISVKAFYRSLAYPDAAPTTVQPNTGETGERARIAERLNRLAKDAWVGSVEEWTAQAVMAMSTASRLLATPATKAETPGPAEGAR